MKVKIKKLHPNAVIPSYAKPGDAGMDLTAVDISLDDKGNVCFNIGLAFEIPKGYAGLLFPRSSISKTHLTLTNSVGVIDSGYRGPVSFKFKRSNLVINWEEEEKKEYLSLEKYKVGDRIGQIIIMPVPSIEFEETDELSSTVRGTGGFGSTGN